MKSDLFNDNVSVMGYNWHNFSSAYNKYILHTSYI